MTKKTPQRDYRMQSKLPLSWILKRSLATFQEKGIRTLIQLSVKNIRHWRYLWRDAETDKHLGVKTAGIVWRQDLDTDSSNKQYANSYKPTGAIPFKAMLSYLPENLERFTFLDFGCGRGRTLLLASAHPFKRILGVEFSVTLHAEAEENIAYYRRQNNTQIKAQVILADATTFPIPSEPLVIYLYDPFDATVMKRVLDNIVASYRSYPRLIYLLYYAPVYTGLILDTGIFSEVSTPPLPPDPALSRQHRFSLFVTPENDAGGV